MRTDAKIGFAVVGVLVAVLVVYLAVIPKKKSTAAAVTVPQGVDTTPQETASIPVVPNISPPTNPVPPTNTMGDSTHDGMVHPDPSHADRLTDRPATDELKKETADTGHSDRSTSHHSTGVRTADRLVDGTDSHTPDVRGGDLRSPDSHTAHHVYTIKPHQTLSAIAAEVYGNGKYWKDIEKDNNGINPARLHAGQKINLPDLAAVRPDPTTVVVNGGAELADATLTGDTYTVKKGDTLYKISKRVFGTIHRADDIYKLNRTVIGADMARLKLGTVLAMPEVTTLLIPTLTDASR